MKTLSEVIRQFTEDKSWNTEEVNGKHRFDDKLAWIEKMVNEYADFFKMTADEVITIMEEKRTYSWPNYYQEWNFPSVENFSDLVGVFKTYKEFNNHTKQHWKGFKCPKCGNIGSDPQDCEHRIKKDGICDWCSYGLISSRQKVIILESGFDAIPIFTPIEKNVG